MSMSTTKLKEALYDCLLKALETDTNTRKVAEGQLKVMEVVSDYALYLTDFALRNDVPEPVRQMSLALFKKYIEENWTDGDAALSTQSKNLIKNRIYHGLKEPKRQLRNSFAYCIAFIVCKDYPQDDWNEFFDFAQHYIYTKRDIPVLGVLRAYQDILLLSDDFHFNELVSILIDSLSHMLKLEEGYPLHIRNECVRILNLLTNIAFNYSNVATDYVRRQFYVFCDLFICSLDNNKEMDLLDFEYKTNVIKYFSICIQEIVDDLEPFLNTVLPIIWRLVVTYSDFYMKAVVFKNQSCWDTESEEGILVGFSPLVLALFDFIHNVVDIPEINHVLNDVLPDIVYYIMVFMLISRQMEQDWSNDIDQYVEENFTNSYNISIRITARDLLMAICDGFNKEYVTTALTQAVNRNLMDTGDGILEDFWWWRKNEVCAYTLGLARNLIISQYERNMLNFNLMQYIEHWTSINVNTPRLLLSRCLWFAAKYSDAIAVDVYNNYVELILKALRSDDMILRVAGIMSLCAFCENYEGNLNIRYLSHYYSALFDALINIVTICGCPEIVIKSGLKSINQLLRIDRNFALSIIHRLLPVIMTLFSKYSHDFGIVKQIKLYLIYNCSDMRTNLNVLEKIVPALANILIAPTDKTSGIQVVAIDLLQTIVKYSKIESNNLFAVLGFPSVIKSIVKSDDHLLMQAGGECLHWCLLHYSNEILNYSDSEGKTGFDYILEAINKLLDPVFSGNVCKHVGKIIITLISKVGSIVEMRIHILLRAILSKMQRAETKEVWQSLLIVFAYLFYVECDATINFLTATPGPTGVSALEFVLSEWLTKESLFYGYYEQVLSIFSCCKLLEYGVQTQNPLLRQIMVFNGDSKNLDIDKQGPSSLYQFIPVIYKAFRVVLSNLYYLTEEKSYCRGSVFDCDRESFTTEDLDYIDIVHKKAEQYIPISHIYTVDLSGYLTDFVVKFKLVNDYDSFAQHLDERDRLVVERATDKFYNKSN